MASSLREIKDRIGSINSTLKITSAMMKVASAKLHRAQRAIENMLPYEQKLHQILMNFLASGVEVKSPLTEEREVKRVAIIAISSNTTLCGAFNANVGRRLRSTVEEYAKKGIKAEDLMIIPIGRQITRFVRKEQMNYKHGEDFGLNFEELTEKPAYMEAASLADQLTKMFLAGEVDRVEIIYNHFKSAGVQEMNRDVYLPLDPKAGKENQGEELILTDYIIEPDPEQITIQLLPKVLNQKVFTVLLDSTAAEHAARMVAMQIATDNGNELIDELTILYNKSRQESITNELLDIMGALTD